jgi:hypothetical protein
MIDLQGPLTDDQLIPLYQATLKEKYDLIKTLQAEISALQATNAAWLKENGPGGWIDGLRVTVAALELENSELQIELSRQQSETAQVRRSYLHEVASRAQAKPPKGAPNE